MLATTEGAGAMKPGPKPSGIVEARARAMSRKLARQKATRERRDAEIVRRYDAGEALIDIACDHEMTKGRVWQIVNRWQSRRTDR